MMRHAYALCAMRNLGLYAQAPLMFLDSALSLTRMMNRIISCITNKCTIFIFLFGHQTCMVWYLDLLSPSVVGAGVDWVGVLDVMAGVFCGVDGVVKPGVEISHRHLNTNTYALYHTKSHTHTHICTVSHHMHSTCTFIINHPWDLYKESEILVPTTPV